MDAAEAAGPVLRVPADQVLVTFVTGRTPFAIGRVLAELDASLVTITPAPGPPA